MSGFYWFKDIVYWLSIPNRPIMPNSNETFLLIAGQSAYIQRVTLSEVKNLLPATEVDYEKSNKRLAKLNN